MLRYFLALLYIQCHQYYSICLEYSLDNFYWKGKIQTNFYLFENPKEIIFSVDFHVSCFQKLLQIGKDHSQSTEESNPVNIISVKYKREKSVKWLLRVVLMECCLLLRISNVTKYSRMDQVKFFNGCLPQILLGPFVYTLSQMLTLLSL